MGKKTTSTTPWKHRVMEQRRADAEARQAEYNKLTPQQKLARLDKLRLSASKERAKLSKKISEVSSKVR